MEQILLILLNVILTFHFLVTLSSYYKNHTHPKLHGCQHILVRIFLGHNTLPHATSPNHSMSTLARYARDSNVIEFHINKSSTPLLRLTGKGICKQKEASVFTTNTHHFHLYCMAGNGMITQLG